MMVHEGQFLDPVLRNMEAFLESSQATVSGDVFVELHPLRFVLHGIESPFDLLGAGFGQYGEMTAGWTGEDVKGFTHTISLAGRIQQHVLGQSNRPS